MPTLDDLQQIPNASQSTAGQGLTLGIDGCLTIPGNKITALTLSGDSAGITIGGDILLYRSASNNLTVSSELYALGNIAARRGDTNQVYMGVTPASVPGVVFGGSGDTNLYRAAAGQLKTDGEFYGVGNSAFAWTGSSWGVTLQTTGAILLTGTNPSLTFSADTNLYRGSANLLKTDDSLYAVLDVCANYGGAGQIFIYQSGGIPTIDFGSSRDTNLYRGGAGVVYTDGNYYAAQEIRARNGGATQVTIGFTSSKAGITFGSSQDANLYRTAASALKTDGSWTVGLALIQKYVDLGTVGAAGTVNIDASLGNIFSVTTTANNVTWAAPTNPSTGQVIYIINRQSGYSTSSYTINAVWKVASTSFAFSSTATGKSGISTWFYDGTNWWETNLNTGVT